MKHITMAQFVSIAENEDPYPGVTVTIESGEKEQKGWLARVRGFDPTYKYRVLRTFLVPRRKFGVVDGGRRMVQVFDLQDANGIYEAQSTAGRIVFTVMDGGVKILNERTPTTRHAAEAIFRELNRIKVEQGGDLLGKR